MQLKIQFSLTSFDSGHMISKNRRCSIEEIFVSDISQVVEQSTLLCTGSFNS